MLPPRDGYFEFDDIFMSIALIMAQRSKDPNTQVGAVLVDLDYRIIGTGYNGFPRNIACSSLPWDKEGKLEDTKYAYVAHAEENVIDNCDRTRLTDAILYVSLFPCNKCAIRIIQNKIKEVVYLSDQYHDTSECIASRRMFELAGIKVRRYVPKKLEISVDLVEGKVS